AAVDGDRGATCRARELLDRRARRGAAAHRGYRHSAHRRTGRDRGRGRRLLGGAAMNLRFWGTRGSLAAPGPTTARYGGNTSSVEVRADDGQVIVLDAGTGIRPLGAALGGLRRVHILLSHLHMDHIQGLGFFAPLFDTRVDVHLWGPATSEGNLRWRLARY